MDPASHVLGLSLLIERDCVFGSFLVEWIAALVIIRYLRILIDKLRTGYHRTTATTVVVFHEIVGRERWNF